MRKQVQRLLVAVAALAAATMASSTPAAAFCIGQCVFVCPDWDPDICDWCGGSLHCTAGTVNCPNDIEFSCY